MSPPIDPADHLEQQFRRIAREEAQRAAREAAAPLAADVRRHSNKISAVREEVSPAVARRISDSNHAWEESSLGMERIIAGRFDDIDVRLERIEKSIPPAAQASKGAELAAVAGAQAVLRVEGRGQALQAAADNAEAASRESKTWTKYASLIQFIINAIVVSVLGYYATHPTPAPDPARPPTHQAP